MQLDSILYIAYSVTSITISVIVALLFWDRRNAAGAKFMALMVCSSALWGLCDFLSDLSSSYLAKVYFDNLSFLGVVAIPVAWLAFVVDHAGYDKFFRRKIFLLLLVIPSITLLMVWTNDFHHLMMTETAMVEVGQMVVLTTSYGLWFWIHAAYSYALFILGIFLLVKKFINLPQILRRQSVIILAAIFVPLVLSILYIFRALPSYPIDPTVFSFTIACILCFFGMFRYKLFDLVPTARNAVAESMNGVLIVLDRHNHIIDMNSAAKKIFAFKEKEFIGKKLFCILGEWSQYFIKYEHEIKVDEKVSIETKDGRKHFDLKVAPLIDSRNRVMGRFITLYDITALEEAIEHFRELRKAAEDANKAKSQFLATMSHEIRTPLNGIIGMTELLASANHTEEEKGYLRLVQGCAGSLLDIVNDILDFSKIEAGKMELEKTVFNLRSTIDAAVKTFFHQGKDKDIALICTIDQEIPEIITGDPVRIRQVLVNLISNAYKFTEKGKIEVKVDLLMYENRQAFLQFSVKDTGIGIPEDKIADLFVSFQQVDSSTTRKYGGTGLGLSIVKNLVAMMGGCIEVESKPCEGSRFFFTLPFEVPENEVFKDVPRPDEDFYDREIRILLVEDNKVNQLLITKLLEKKKVNVDVAGNGKEALSKLEEKAYDLILMDIQMPEMDGYETTQVIRKNEAEAGNHVPIIALTANAAEEDKNMCLQAGMDDYLTKPVRTEKLFKCIEKYF